MYYFWNSYTRFIKPFLNFPLWICYSATIFIIGIMLTTWFFFIYIPLTNTIEQRIVLLEKEQKQTIDMKEKEAERSTLEKQIEHNKKLLQQEVVSHAMQERIKKLLNQLQQLNISLEQYVPLESVTKEWYTKQKIKLIISGSFENIYTIFQKIIPAHSMINLKTIIITKNDAHILHADMVLNCITLNQECYA